MNAFQVSRATTTRRLGDINGANVAAMVGEISHGCEIFGVSKGQFTLFGLARHCLETTGPASVIVSTWATANSDLEHSHAILESGLITDMTWFVDKGFPNRQPGYCAKLVALFGTGCIVAAPTHAKFVVIENAGWSVVIRASMNMSPRQQLETYDVSENRAMAAMLRGAVESFRGDGAAVKAHPVAAKRGGIDYGQEQMGIEYGD